MNYSDKKPDIDHVNNFLHNDDKKEKPGFRREKFYFAEKSTTKLPSLLSRETIKEEVDKIVNEKIKLTKQDLKEEFGMEETPEMIENRNNLKDRLKIRLIKFAQERGLNVKDRLAENDDIYFLNKKGYEDIGGDINEHGCNIGNDIFVRGENNADENTMLQHELVHSACLHKFYISNNPVKENNKTHVISSGYASCVGNKYLKYFNEGLTEVTALQISMENKDISYSKGGYRPHVILITELVRDVAEKLSERENMNITQKDILTHLQIGMFQAKRGYLGIISDIYGKGALESLMKMGMEKQDVIEVSRIFKLLSAEKKITDYYNNKETRIHMGDSDIVFNSED
ncbi:MAG: hypothetical protein WC788_03040 [Candidatus Paceibacterota bacterium]